MHPNDLKHSGSADADNAILFETRDVSECPEHTIRVIAGEVDVEVSIDGGATWTDSSAAPVGVMKLSVTNPSTWSLSIAAGEIAVLVGRFDRIRLRQVGDTAAEAQMSSYKNYLT